MQSPLMPKVGKQHIENTEQVGNTCTQCHQRIHIGGTVLCLLPSVYKKIPAQPYYNGRGKEPHYRVCIGHIHKEHSYDYHGQGKDNCPNGLVFQGSEFLFVDGFERFLLLGFVFNQ